MATRAPLAQPLPDDIRLMEATARGLFVLAALVLLAWALVWASHRPAFALRSVAVEGDLAHNSAVTIRANALPKLVGNFFTIDLAQGRRAFESVPWVRQAVVSRVWPNRLRVSLQEHRAVALWASPAKSEDADRLVNSQGEVFEANLGDVEDESLPTLRGPVGASASMLAMLGRLQAELAPMDTQVETLELSGRGSWRAELDNGAEIELGRGTEDEVLARTKRFVATLPELKQRYLQHPLLHADLRHRDGYAVRLKGVTTTLDAPAAQPPKK